MNRPSNVWKLASRLVAAGLLINTLAAVGSIGCQTDLGVEERAFECVDQSDCLPDFECLPVGGTSELKQCVQGPTDADAADTFASDTAASDTAADTSSSDTSSSDTAESDTGGHEGCGNETSDPLLAQSISVGYNHACAIEKDTGQAYCWGSRQKGQLGDGDANLDPQLTPAPVQQNDVKMHLAAISAGYEFTCALEAQGGVYCWGSNESMKLGAGPQSSATTIALPTEVVGIGSDSSNQLLTGIDTGGHHACAMNQNTIYCWGSNSDSQLGSTASEIEPSGDPVAVDALSGTPKRMIAAGPQGNCAIVDTKVHCWGRNSRAEVGGDYASDTPRAPSPENSISTHVNSDWNSMYEAADVAIGLVQPGQTVGASACALNTAGDVFCWGEATFGVVVGASTSFRSYPAKIDFNPQQVLGAVTVGAKHACALNSEGQAYCWGTNDVGQLGRSQLGADPLAPAAVETDLRFIELSAGTNVTCGITDSHHVYCWGDAELNGRASEPDGRPASEPRRVDCPQL